MKLRAMLLDFKTLETLSGADPSEFWHLWLLRHGEYLKQTKHFYRFIYHGWWIYYNVDVVLFFFALFLAIILVSVVAISRARAEFNERGTALIEKTKKHLKNTV